MINSLHTFFDNSTIYGVLGKNETTISMSQHFTYESSGQKILKNITLETKIEHMKYTYFYSYAKKNLSV